MEYDIIQKPPCGRREDSEYYIAPVYRGIIDEENMVHTIVRSSSFTRGDVLGCISALTEQMAQALAEGNRVKISGLGTFRLQITTPTKNLKATDKVAKHIEVRDVEFRPEQDFMERFLDVTFSRTTHSRTLRRVADSETLIESLRTYFATNEFLRSVNVQSLARCSRATACRILSSLVEEGYLLNVGNRRTPLYRATEKLTD